MAKSFQGNIKKFFWWPSFIEDKKTGKKKFLWLVSKTVGKIRVTGRNLIPEIGMVDTYWYEYVLNYSRLSLEEIESNKVGNIKENRKRLINEIIQKQEELNKMINSLISEFY